MASRLIRNQLPSRVAGSTPVSSAFDASPFNDDPAEAIRRRRFALRQIKKQRRLPTRR